MSAFASPAVLLASEAVRGAGELEVLLLSLLEVRLARLPFSLLLRLSLLEMRCGGRSASLPLGARGGVAAVVITPVPRIGRRAGPVATARLGVGDALMPGGLSAPSNAASDFEGRGGRPDFCEEALDGLEASCSSGVAFFACGSGAGASLCCRLGVEFLPGLRG